MQNPDDRHWLCADLPVLAITGFSGSGKTTLIEAILPRLLVQGLSVVVIKHDAHGLQIDHPGKDSDRLFRAGADIALHGPAEILLRAHADRPFPLATVLETLTRRYDLVLVEGHKETPLRKVWLAGDDGHERPPSGVTGVVGCLSRGQDRRQWLLDFIADWLPAQWSRRPLYGCVLIGGRSRRMGEAKHLLRDDDGRTWLERTLATLQEVVGKSVIAGAGQLPPTLPETTVRLADVDGVDGPLAGILAALRWAPAASWLVVACDLPRLEAEALRWLQRQRRPGVWAVLPRSDTANDHVEPLLACYEAHAGHWLEQLRSDDRPAPHRLASYARCLTPLPPAAIRSSWFNANSAADLD